MPSSIGLQICSREDSAKALSRLDDGILKAKCDQKEPTAIQHELHSGFGAQLIKKEFLW